MDDEQVSREIDELQRDLDDDPSLVQRMRGPHRTGTTIYVLTVTPFSSPPAPSS